MLKWLETLPADTKPPSSGPEKAKAGSKARQTEPGNRAPASAPGPTLAELLARVQPLTDADDRAYLETRAATDPEGTAALCQLILAFPRPPTAAEVAELDNLIVRLCELWPWAKGMASELLRLRRRMAPARVIEELELFRAWVRESEAGSQRAGNGRSNTEAM